MKVRRQIRLLMRSSFVRSVALLVGGTAFTQVLMVLILPILTRLYTPEDFSVLTVYLSILSVFAAVACLRYEIAIPLPESDEDAANVLGLALILSFSISTVVAVLIAFFRDEIITLIGQPALQPYVWIIPLGIWVTSTYGALKYWVTREKHFGVIARVQVVQSLSSSGTQLGLGVLGVAPLGLLLGSVVNSALGGLSLAFLSWRQEGRIFKTIRPRRMLTVASQYKNFPKFSVFDALANNAGTALPVLIIAAMAFGPEAGYLALATQVLGAPLSLVGTAVGQVYFSHAADKQRTGDIEEFTLSTIRGLARFGIGPMLFAGIVSPIAFPLVFGEAWMRAGELISWLAPWYAIRFISSPISSSLNVTGNIRLGMYLQILGLIIRTGAVAFAAIWARSMIVEVYAVISVGFELFYLFIVTRSAGISALKVISSFVYGWRMILVWLLVALTANWAMRALVG